MIGALLKEAIATLAPQALAIHGDRRTNRVALTFDDGPHPEHTPTLLDILDDCGTPATFFLQGSQALKHPQLVRTIHQRGHEIGNHGSTHQKPSELGTAAYVQEIVDTHALLCDIVGQSLAKHFRPPYGATSPGTFIQLARQGFQFIYWSRDSRDSWLKQSAELSAAFEQTPVRPGDIVLFHDDYAQTAKALPSILRTWAHQGLQVQALSDMLASRSR